MKQGENGRIAGLVISLNIHTQGVFGLGRKSKCYPPARVHRVCHCVKARKI